MLCYYFKISRDIMIDGENMYEVDRHIIVKSLADCLNIVSANRVVRVIHRMFLFCDTTKFLSKINN